jgi:hypothetical protein
MTDAEGDALHNAREATMARACIVMGWDYKKHPAWTGLRHVATGRAIVISVEKMNEILDRLETLLKTPKDY